MATPFDVPYLSDPTWLGVYSFNFSGNGVAAANRFLSLFNPSGSGRNLVLLSVELESYSVAVSAAVVNLILARITAASAGTLEADANVAKFTTADSDPSAEVRFANPTVTAAAAITSFAPNQNITAAGATAVARRLFRPDPTWGEFVLTEGEGVVLYQLSAGDTDQRIHCTFVWAER